jgi:hypothetical protein
MRYYMFLRFISIASKLLRPNNPGIALGSKSGNSGKASLDLADPLESSPTEPRLKIFVLESVCAPCVQNLGQWTNPNTLGQQGGYNQTCPEQSQPTPRSGQNANQNWQQNTVSNTIERAVGYSTHDRPKVTNTRIPNNLPLPNQGMGRRS